MVVNYSHVFEKADGPRESLSRDNGFEGTIVYQCDWNDRIQLMVDKLTEDGGLGEVYPHQAVLAARAQSARCVTAEGLELPAGFYGLGAWEHAFVEITYRTPGRGNDQQPETSDLVTETLEGHAEFQTLAVEEQDPDYPDDPTKTIPVFVWESDFGRLSKDEAPGILIRGIDYLVTIQQVSEIATQILDLTGCVNEAAIVSPTLGRTFGVETLMYNEPQLTRKFNMTTGLGMWTVTERFSYRKSGWNKFWRAKTGQWEEIFLVGSGTPYKNYTPSSFVGLLPWVT